MLETMRKANGIGLAGNQVGLLQRIIVVDVADADEFKNVPPLIMLNPEVVGEEGEWAMEEGCLSIPEIREEVVRPETIHVRYNDPDFEQREIEARGLLGRVILHEIDHLNGVLFIDHLSGLKRKMLRGRLNKIRRGETEVTYPIVAESLPVLAER
jgi:peptide deformylase